MEKNEGTYAEAQDPKKTRRCILELTNSEAKDFFLKAESYCNFELPPYFKFEKLLKDVSDAIDSKNLKDFENQEKKIQECENVNHVLYNNKNGQYAWRPISLINPAVYVSLVNAITKEESWKHIVKKFKEYGESSKIDCLSLPVEALSKKSDKAEQILHWWEEIEQRSIGFSLDYDYVAVTDITDCYSSLYTHSIAWALHTKCVAKKEKGKDDLIGNLIDSHIRDMSLGQTNGIPQGSVLMDFIAEMVLGYADSLLARKLRNQKIDEKAYHILRYRDDYRVFSKDQQSGEAIIKALTEVLIDLGLKLNPTKTAFSHKLINSAIKPEKRYWMTQKQSAKDIREHLIIIHEIAEKFPNSGGLVKALNKFYNKILRYKKIDANILMLVGIVTDIAYRNPRCYPLCCAIISKFLEFIEGNDEKTAVIEKIRMKFEKLPNTGHLDIYLQRISAPINQKMPYDSPLCKIVAGEKIDVWNTNWLKGNLKKLIDKFEVFDQQILDGLTSSIPKTEVDLFTIHYESRT